jgi:hypothetical protein
MPLVAPDSESDGGFTNTLSPGGMAQINAPVIPVPIPTSIAASATWNSGLIFSDGYRYLTVAVTASQTGSLVITQFVDMAGTIARPAITNPIVAATPLIIDIPGTLTPNTATTAPAYPYPFMSFTVQIINSTTISNISAFQVLLSGG